MALSRQRPTTNQAARKRTRAVGRGGTVIPVDSEDLEVAVGEKRVHLTHLQKPFWPELGLTKGDLIRYYADIAPVLLPHLAQRAMVMKRYPNGAAGKFFFQKRVPEPHPDWLQICPIEHPAAGLVAFPVIRDLPSLLWIINLGCIDLNPWYARCDDVNRPDYLHFDLDPAPGAGFKQVCETAMVVHQALDTLDMPNFAKTTGSRGIHVYVPIERGPSQKEVWAFAKELAQSLAVLRPELITAEYRIGKRPRGRVLVDYNQNAWGRTLASVYSVRPTALATVSAPVSWTEVRRGIQLADFRLQNMRARIRKVGDLWEPLLQSRGRYNLVELLGAGKPPTTERLKPASIG